MGGLNTGASGPARQTCQKSRVRERRPLWDSLRGLVSTPVPSRGVAATPRTPFSSGGAPESWKSEKRIMPRRLLQRLVRRAGRGGAAARRTRCRTAPPTHRHQPPGRVPRQGEAAVRPDRHQPGPAQDRVEGRGPAPLRQARTAASVGRVSRISRSRAQAAPSSVAGRSSGIPRRRTTQLRACESFVICTLPGLRATHENRLKSKGLEAGPGSQVVYK